MDPSIQFLLGNDAPKGEGATIHSIAPPTPDSINEEKIGFTLDVAVRLVEESDEIARGGVVVPMIENPPQELADSA